MICGSRFYRRLYKPILLRINKFTWNKFYVSALGNISALEALNSANTIILNDILHFLGPISFEKIMSLSNKLINLLLGGSVVSYLVLNSILLFFMVIVLFFIKNINHWQCIFNQSFWSHRINDLSSLIKKIKNQTEKTLFLSTPRPFL